MARSTFYYHLKALERPGRYEAEKKRICEIFHESKGRYGYRRVTMQLRNEGIAINHKTVERLMKELGLLLDKQRVLERWILRLRRESDMVPVWTRRGMNDDTLLSEMLRWLREQKQKNKK